MCSIEVRYNFLQLVTLIRYFLSCCYLLIYSSWHRGCYLTYVIAALLFQQWNIFFIYKRNGYPQLDSLKLIVLQRRSHLLVWHCSPLTTEFIFSMVVGFFLSGEKYVC